MTRAGTRTVASRVIARARQHHGTRVDRGVLCSRLNVPRILQWPTAALPMENPCCSCNLTRKAPAAMPFKYMDLRNKCLRAKLAVTPPRRHCNITGGDLQGERGAGVRDGPRRPAETPNVPGRRVVRESALPVQVQAAGGPATPATQDDVGRLRQFEEHSCATHALHQPDALCHYWKVKHKGRRWPEVPEVRAEQGLLPCVSQALIPRHGPPPPCVHCV